MAGQKKIIRNKIKELLMDKTSAGDAVFSNRAITFSDERLPAINIQTVNESAELWSQAKKTYKRKARIAIICAAKANEDVDDLLDDMADEIEEILLLDESLGDTVETILYKDTQLNVEMGDGTLGAQLINFEVTYYTDHQPPIEDSFNTMHYEIKEAHARDKIFEGTLDLEE
jgi:hypothetical protein